MSSHWRVRQEFVQKQHEKTMVICRYQVVYMIVKVKLAPAAIRMSVSIGMAGYAQQVLTTYAGVGPEFVLVPVGTSVRGVVARLGYRLASGGRDSDGDISAWSVIPQKGFNAEGNPLRTIKRWATAVVDEQQQKKELVESVVPLPGPSGDVWLLKEPKVGNLKSTQFLVVPSRRRKRKKSSVQHAEDGIINKALEGLLLDEHIQGDEQGEQGPTARKSPCLDNMKQIVSDESPVENQDVEEGAGTGAGGEEVIGKSQRRNKPRSSTSKAQQNK